MLFLDGSIAEHIGPHIGIAMEMHRPGGGTPAPGGGNRCQLLMPAHAVTAPAAPAPI